LNCVGIRLADALVHPTKSEDPPRRTPSSLYQYKCLLEIIFHQLIPPFIIYLINTGFGKEFLKIFLYFD
jgi:hypothetical protein